MNQALKNRLLLMSEIQSKEVLKETADFVAIVDEIMPKQKPGFSWLWIVRNIGLIKELLTLLYDFYINAKNKVQ